MIQYFCSHINNPSYRIYNIFEMLGDFIHMNSIIKMKTVFDVKYAVLWTAQLRNGVRAT